MNFDKRPNRRQKILAAVKIVEKQSTTGCHDVDSGAECFGHDATFYHNSLQVTPLHRAVTLWSAFYRTAGSATPE